MPLLLRFLGLQHSSPAERRAAAWIAAMFCAALASTYLLRPLRDQFGVAEGVPAMPWLYTCTLLATAVAVPPFWWVANRMPSRRFVPLVLHVCTVVVLLFALGLGAVGEYDWKQLPWFGEWFWGGFSALNVIVPTLVWIHAVEHFRSVQARRLFGLIAVGGTLGAIGGSWLAGWLFRSVAKGGLGLPAWVAAVVAAVLLQAMWGAFLGSQAACRELDGQRDRAARADRVAGGGVTEGLRILARSGRAQAIGCYMVLLGVVATAFAAAQTEIVGEGIANSRDQSVWFATVEFWVQSLNLVLQLFCTGRLMQRWPGAVLLVSLPLVSILGLAALWLAPAVLTMRLVQIGRRGAQYSFEKPAREVLYTPLALATKHKVKFLLDTFAFRLGDLAGAGLAVGLRAWNFGSTGIVATMVLFALAWIALGIALGRRRAEPLAADVASEAPAA